MLQNLVRYDEVEDYRQDLALAVLAKDRETIEAMEMAGQLAFYCTRIVLNIRAVRHKKAMREKRELANGYRHKVETDSITGSDIDAACCRELFQQKMSHSAEGMHEVKIFETYLQTKSCRIVAEHYGIPHYHVNDVVKKIREELKKEIRRRL
jgi:Tfp pilus assembly PilM family ATPase